MLKALICVDCRVEFTYDHRKGPTRQRCDACTTARKRAVNAAKAQRWRQQDPERQRAYSRRAHEKRKDDPAFRQRKRDNELMRVYGITRAELDALRAAQGDACAICGGGRTGPGTRLHIDHCHKSNRIRGLLCSKCNTAVGLLDDDPVRAEALAIYLRQ